jgi:hypothetical protein
MEGQYQVGLSAQQAFGLLDCVAGPQAFFLDNKPGLFPGYLSDSLGPPADDDDGFGLGRSARRVQ